MVRMGVVGTVTTVQAMPVVGMTTPLCEPRVTAGMPVLVKPGGHRAAVARAFGYVGVGAAVVGGA
jgi:hypothetical protein